MITPNTINYNFDNVTLLPIQKINPYLLSFTKRKRVFITGSAGNLGKECVFAAERNFYDTQCIPGKNTLDLTNPAEVNEHIKIIAPVDIIIMAHGFQTPMQIRDVCDFPHLWSTVIEANLSSCAYITSAILANGKIKKGGLFVFISSIQASIPREGRGAYAAAKAGVEALMRTTAQEVKHFGARAIALRLGQFDATMKGIKFTEQQMKDIGKKMPLGLIDPKSVATLIFSLYENPHITGEVISIDSGHSLQIWT